MTNGSRKATAGLRQTLRKLIGLHRSRVEEMIEELEHGARLGPWVDQAAREFGAGVTIMRGVNLRSGKLDLRPRRS